MGINHNKTLILFDIDNTLIKSNNIFQLLVNPSILNNEDIIPILSKLQQSYTLGIWSQGFIKIQLTKLKIANLISYFNKDQIWISHKKIDLLHKINSQNFQKIYIIDDKDFSEYIEAYPKLEYVNEKYLSNLEQHLL